MYQKKLLKTHLLSALKFGKVVDNNAWFVWIEKEKKRRREESSRTFAKKLIKIH